MFEYEERLRKQREKDAKNSGFTGMITTQKRAASVSDLCDKEWLVVGKAGRFAILGDVDYTFPYHEEQKYREFRNSGVIIVTKRYDEDRSCVVLAKLARR